MVNPQEKQEKERPSLSGVISGFMYYAKRHGKETFPYFADRRWHEFLYELTKQNELEFLFLKKFSRFDWDGFCHKSPSLREVMPWVARLCFIRYQDFRMTLTSPMLTGNRFSEDYPILAEKALELASRPPGFFVTDVGRPKYGRHLFCFKRPPFR